MSLYPGLTDEELREQLREQQWVAHTMLALSRDSATCHRPRDPLDKSFGGPAILKVKSYSDLAFLTPRDARNAAWILVKMRGQDSLISPSSSPSPSPKSDYTDEGYHTGPDEPEMKVDCMKRLSKSHTREQDQSGSGDTTAESDTEVDIVDLTAGHAQIPFKVHGKRNCLASTCRTKCNGKRTINAQIEAGSSLDDQINVCEPDCSNAKPACLKGCTFIEDYNAYVAIRNEHLDVLGKIQGMQAQITWLREWEQREEANDAEILIRRAERKIDTLQHRAEELARQLASSPASPTKESTTVVKRKPPPPPSKNNSVSTTKDTSKPAADNEKIPPSSSKSKSNSVLRNHETPCENSQLQESRSSSSSSIVKLRCSPKHLAELKRTGKIRRLQKLRLRSPKLPLVPLASTSTSKSALD